ncbi:hypothetical protein LP416_09460 [Polaromonas sp. P2-4]|nr:hypothetical protein LP416_09460 [Polaromonas sp. P2-4]
MNTLHQPASCVVAAPSARASHSRKSIAAPADSGSATRLRTTDHRGDSNRPQEEPKEPNHNTTPTFNFLNFYKEAP